MGDASLGRSPDTPLIHRSSSSAAEQAGRLVLERPGPVRDRPSSSLDPTTKLKGTKISIRRLIRSNVQHCAASSHHGRKDVGVRSSVPRFLHPVAPRVGYDFDGNTRSLIIA